MGPTKTHRMSTSSLVFVSVEAGAVGLGHVSMVATVGMRIQGESSYFANCWV